MFARQFALGAAALIATSLPAVAGFEGSSYTVYGQSAGAALTTGYGHTFIGGQAGEKTTAGLYSTYVGMRAGQESVTSSRNTALGAFAGAFVDGVQNVFLGYGAGANETGSNKLVIDNCFTGGSCTKPLVYGEFNNRLLRLDGVFHAAAGGAPKSQLHFSLDHTDTGGYLTSVLDNNFFMSSGARWDGNAGGWIQRSPDGKAVIAGSGGVGFRVLTASGSAVGAVASPVVRLHLDYAGNLGLNTAAVAGKAIDTATGAYLSTGGAWVNASSRALKDDIRELSSEDALRTLEALRPVTFRYTAEAGETHAGFIAEEAPELVATQDRKGLGAMDVVAVLTRALQERSRAIERQEARIAELTAKLAEVDVLKARLEALAERVQALPPR